MPETNPTQRPTPVPRLEQAIQLAKQGQRPAACDMLRQIVAYQPVNQAAWLWLSAVAAEKVEAEAALTQARKINPTHQAIPRAEQWLAQRFSPPVTPVRAAPLPPSKVSPPPIVNRLKLPNSLALLGVSLLILLGFVVLGMVLTSEMKATAQASQPEAEPPAQVDPLPSQATLLDETWLKHDWPQAIKILETYHKKQPDSLPIKWRLAEAYRRNGLTLRYEGLIEEAQQNFRQALPLDPQNKVLEQELTFATNYLTGKQHYQRGEWAEAMAALQSIYTQEPTYANVKDLLFSATYNQGLTLQAQAELPAAQTALAAAIALRPDLAEPRLRLAEVEFALSPETPPEIPIAAVPIKDRLVLVGIAEQRMHVYEGDKLIYDFIVSTGEPGRPTAIGEFEILNKIEVAYASTWNLDMPNWLGIYWAGPLQNGIHSLPTVKHTGQTLWDGYLGQRVSYGCVILGEEESATLYQWAEVGTKVKIVPSLADYELTN